jgi:hypothetical protein
MPVMCAAWDRQPHEKVDIAREKAFIVRMAEQRCQLTCYSCATDTAYCTVTSGWGVDVG